MWPLLLNIIKGVGSVAAKGATAIGHAGMNLMGLGGGGAPAIGSIMAEGPSIGLAAGKSSSLLSNLTKGAELLGKVQGVQKTVTGNASGGDKLKSITGAIGSSALENLTPTEIEWLKKQMEGNNG